MNPNNLLQTVTTYVESGLGLLTNQTCFVRTWNTDFKEFNEDFTANLGSTVNLDKAPRIYSNNGLVANFNGVVQRLQPLSCDQALNAAIALTAQELIFNLDKTGGSYLPRIAESMITSLANDMDRTIALNANSSMPVFSVVNGESVPTGALHTESGPFRYFGDGNTAINSFKQLAQIVTNFNNFGAVPNQYKFYLPDVVVPEIVNNGLNEFVWNRNEVLAESWMLARYANVDYYRTNLLPTHIAGTVGNNQDTLTVVSTNDPTGQNITQITFSGVTVNAGAFKSGDVFTFLDNVTGRPNLRFNRFIGRGASQQPVQCRVLADADATGGTVTVNIYPGLTVGYPQNDNIGINNNIIAGMQIKAARSHICGLLTSGDAGFIAMPRLPSTDPFTSFSVADPETKASLRGYYGYRFPENIYGFIYDLTFGATLPPENCIRICFPIV